MDAIDVVVLFQNLQHEI